MFNYDLKWIKKPGKGDWYWIDEIFRELGHYYNKFIDDIAEIPFDFTERSIVSHIAIAAHECCYYTIQDYGTKIEGECPEDKKWRFPDLWLTMEPRENSFDVLFEAKKMVKDDQKSIDKIDIKKNLEKSVYDLLCKAHNQCSETSPAEKVKWQCALAAITIRCEKTEWDKYGKDECSYYGKLDELKEGIKKFNWTEINKPAFFFYYWIPFKNQTGNLIAPPYNKWKNKLPELFGVLIFGSFKPVNSKRNLCREISNLEIED